MRNELVLSRKGREIKESRQTSTMSPTEQNLLTSIKLFWDTYRIGLIDPMENQVTDGTLIEWRSNVTRNITSQFVSKTNRCLYSTIDTKIGKALYLGRAFKMHIETLRFLFEQIPELRCLQQESRQVE